MSRKLPPYAAGPVGFSGDGTNIENSCNQASEIPQPPARQEVDTSSISSNLEEFLGRQSRTSISVSRQANSSVSEFSLNGHARPLVLSRQELAEKTKFQATAHRQQRISEIKSISESDLSNLSIDKLWSLFQCDKSNVAVRNAIVQFWLPYIRMRVSNYFSRLPYAPIVERDDMENDVIIGLTEAISSFDPSRHIKFETYAEQRLHGAATDGLRRLQPFSRKISLLRRQVKSRINALRQELGHNPSHQEFVDCFGEEWWDVLNNPLLDSQVYNQGLHDSSPDTDEDQGSEPSWLAVEGNIEGSNKRMQLAEILDMCIDYLSDDWIQSQIFFLRFYFDYTLERIGKADGIDMSTSSVSKCLRDVISKLRQMPGLREQLRYYDLK